MLKNKRPIKANKMSLSLWLFFLFSYISKSNQSNQTHIFNSFFIQLMTAGLSKYSKEYFWGFCRQPCLHSLPSLRQKYCLMSTLDARRHATETLCLRCANTNQCWHNKASLEKHTPLLVFPSLRRRWSVTRHCCRPRDSQRVEWR